MPEGSEEAEEAGAVLPDETGAAAEEDDVAEVELPEQAARELRAISPASANEIFLRLFIVDSSIQYNLFVKYIAYRDTALYILRHKGIRIFRVSFAGSTAYCYCIALSRCSEPCPAGRMQS